MDYHMKFLEFLSLLQKTWTIICDFWNFFLFFKNVDYHMQFLKFLSPLQIHGLSYAVLGICFSSTKKNGLSYAIYKISLLFPKTWTITSNFKNLFHISKNMDYHMKLLKNFSLLQKCGLSLQFLEFLSLLHIHGLSYAISEISFSSTITWAIICNLWNFFPISKNLDYLMIFLKFLFLLQKRGYHMRFR